MKLYSVGLSPFAARVRAAIYARGLDIEIVAPPATGTKSPEYLALNPMGKIPVLVLDDGATIPESDTIVEYLEDAFAQNPLRPADPAAAAKARLVARVAELYVWPHLSALFPQMNPKTRDQAVVDAAIGEAQGGGLTHLERLPGRWPVRRRRDVHHRRLLACAGAVLRRRGRGRVRRRRPGGGAHQAGRLRRGDRLASGRPEGHGGDAGRLRRHARRLTRAQHGRRPFPGLGEACGCGGWPASLLGCRRIRMAAKSRSPRRVARAF